ncbi:hypothetical protein HTZ84_21090 [Haloterrigena sp. SYSU A558-1]|uniref:Uncharacterized protein n=1 Tax=Haloterrigena gelatinilytica TaxID=2741724 RepID=A0ABX2LPE1_9EURY|nr:hypothetical protein [Haloterrigena gelatinilytica]NUC74761.1 hypothetical protein [Haloterrigena gelatinilytica]
MIDERYVHRFQQKGWTPADLDADVVLSSTFDDEELELWFPDRELAVATEYGASGIVPCDTPVYRDDPQSFRVETIRTYAETLADVIPQFRDHGIEPIPLVKGETPYERDICYEVFDHYGIDRVAYYCAQYFSYGNRFPDLLRRLQEIAIEYEPDDILAIGLQSENLLPQLPPAVSGAAGQRWLRVTDVGSEPAAVAVRQYEQWAASIHSALQIGQAPLDAYFPVRGWS